MAGKRPAKWFKSETAGGNRLIHVEVTAGSFRLEGAYLRQRNYALIEAWGEITVVVPTQAGKPWRRLPRVYTSRAEAQQAAAAALEKREREWLKRQRRK